MSQYPKYNLNFSIIVTKISSHNLIVIVYNFGKQFNHTLHITWVFNYSHKSVTSHSDKLISFEVDICTTEIIPVPNPETKSKPV